MTEKAGIVAKDILQELLVQATEQPIIPDEQETCFRYMNRWMTMVDAMGTSLGYTKVTNPNDDITIPDGAIMGLIKNVALVLARQFDVPITGDLVAEAERGYMAMRRLADPLQPSQFPCTLPIGSGNEWDGFQWTHFYCCDENQGILTETNRNILIEDNTPNGTYCGFRSGDAN